MKNFLKFAAIFLGLLILLLVVGVVVLTTFVSPNRFKPMITEQVKKFTGRDFVIDGDLSWSFFPYLGMKAGHMALSNPAGFQQKTFAEIQSATLGVKLMPLFQARIESSGIALNGMTLHLIKNTNGKTNWEDLQPKPQVSQIATVNNRGQSTLKTMTLSIAVAGIDVTNANIDWIDETAKQKIDIEQFELHAKNISLNDAFPVSAAFQFKSMNPTASGKILFSSHVTLDLVKQLYVMKNVDFSANIKQDAKTFDINVKGNVIADLNQQTLQWNDFAAQIANLKLNGKMDVSDLSSSPRAKGHFTITPFDFKKWLQLTGQDNADLKSVKNVSGDMDFSAASKSVIAESHLQVDEVQTKQLKLTTIRVKTRMENGIVDIAPMTANFYEGTIEARAKINLNTSVPEINFQTKLNNVQAEPLMKDMAGADTKIKVIGAGNAELTATTSGKDGDTIVKNLNGTGQFNFKNGTIEGINIGYLIDSAHALATKQSMPAQNDNKTVFGNLTGTLTIKDGIISNNDLLLDSPRFNTNGQGTINLVSKEIDYRLQASIKQKSADQKDDLSNLYGIPIPIKVTGNLNKPSVRVDTSTLLKAVGTMQMKRMGAGVEKKLQDQLKDKLPGKAADILQNFLGQ